MRNLIFSAILLASAFQTALGETWEDYQYSVNNGEVTITYYNGSASVLNIPSNINNLPVRKIGDLAFGANYSREFRPELTRVIIDRKSTRLNSSH